MYGAQQYGAQQYGAQQYGAQQDDAFFNKTVSSITLQYVRSGDTYNPDGAYMQKTVIAMTKFTSKPLLIGPPPRATHFSLRSYHHRSASAKSAAARFFAPHPDPSRRPPGWGWGQEALSSPLADSPIMRMLSKMVKKPRRNSPRTLRAPKLAPSSCS